MERARSLLPVTVGSKLSTFRGEAHRDPPHQPPNLPTGRVERAGTLACETVKWMYPHASLEVPMHRALVVTAALVITLFAVPAWARYEYQTVDYPGAQQTLILAINDLGHYVGLVIDTANTPHALYFDGHRLALLDANGLIGKSAKSRAYALNNLDEIAGSYVDAAGKLHGFLYCHGEVTTVDDPSGQPTEAYGINDLGQAIGVSYDAAGNPHGFTLRRGKYQPIDVPGSVSTNPLSINDREEIVGEVIDIAGTVGHGYLEKRDGSVTRYDAPGAPANSTYLVSTNNLDQTLGAYLDAAGSTNNFVLDHGTLTSFNVPASFGASGVTAQTINDFGTIVGYYTDAAGKNHGFIALAKDE
jgi:probable HAF family extracellular repeat protein